MIDQSAPSQLDALIENARLITQLRNIAQLADRLKEKQCRLRPSVGSFGLISYSDDTPQRGFSNIRSPSRLTTKLEVAIQPPRRLTREKRLQSWLIRSAFSNKGEMISLSRCLGGKFWLVSDEIAIKAPRDQSSNVPNLVADLLLIAEDDGGNAGFVNVELKSSRLKKTFDQVTTFRSLLEDKGLISRWRKFAEIMIGDALRWKESPETRGIVIWPKSEDPKRAAANKWRGEYERIDLIGYNETLSPDRYSLECE